MEIHLRALGTVSEANVVCGSSILNFYFQKRTSSTSKVLIDCTFVVYESEDYVKEKHDEVYPLVLFGRFIDLLLRLEACQKYRGTLMNDLKPKPA